MSARNETPHKIIQSLGKKKCNGSWEEATENLTMEQVKKLAEAKEDISRMVQVAERKATLPQD